VSPWKVTYRPGEGDFLVERDDAHPIIVVRPRVGDPLGHTAAKLLAGAIAEMLASTEITVTVSL
jgi:hypothetical protein